MERNEEQNARVQLPFMEKTLPVELNTEITLPDYRSEISRLLWVRPVLLPPTHFIGNGKVDFSGSVCYHILYVGADGALYGTESPEAYQFSVSTEGLSDFESGVVPELCVSTVPDAVVSRVLAPRKLSVRCRMHAQLQGYVVKSLSPQLQGEHGELCRLCAAAENGRLTAGEPEEIEISGKLTVPPGEGELRVITATGGLTVPHIAADGDAVRCDGEAVLRLLLTREGAGEQTPFTAECRIPFEQEISLSGLPPMASVRVHGAVREIRSTVEGDTVALEVVGALTAEGQGEEAVLLSLDLFSAGYGAEYRTREERLWRAGPCGNRNFSVSGERTLAELGLSADAECILAVADGEVRERSVEGDKTVLSGEVCCHLLYKQSEEYRIADFSIPFRTFLEEEWDRVACSATVPSCRVSLIRDGEALRADAEVYLSVRAGRVAPTAVLASAAFHAAEHGDRADLEICYPCAGESLWEVSKRYGASPEAIANANALSAEEPGAKSSLDGVRYLIIP